MEFIVVTSMHKLQDSNNCEYVGMHQAATSLKTKQIGFHSSFVKHSNGTEEVFGCQAWCSNAHMQFQWCLT